MLVDANLLLYATDSASPHHGRAAGWLSEALNDARRVGIPWQTIGAFVRIATHPRVTMHPLTGAAAWAFVEEWLAAPVTWVPQASERTAVILGRLIGRYGLTANAVPDAQLAALAIEHGLQIVTADTDFARFDEARWINPLR